MSELNPHDFHIIIYKLKFIHKKEKTFSIDCNIG